MFLLLAVIVIVFMYNVDIHVYVHINIFTHSYIVRICVYMVQSEVRNLSMGWMRVIGVPRTGDPQTPTRRR